MERITDKFDDEIQHIAMKTGLKTWHVIAALVGKLPYLKSRQAGRQYFRVIFAWFLRPVVPFENLLLIYATTDDHKNSPFPSLPKVCSVQVNIFDVSWHLSKRGSELAKR